MKNSPLADTVERVACVYRHFREWTESIPFPATIPGILDDAGVDRLCQMSLNASAVVDAEPRTVPVRTAF